MGRPARNWIWTIAVTVSVLAGLCALWCGMRSFRTFVLLRSAYEIGMPQASTLRAWMTLRYVVSTYRIPETQIRESLALPPTVSLDTSLRSLAERKGMTPFAYVQQVQRSMAERAPPAQPEPVREKSDWFEWFNDQVLSGLLRHGYAVLALILLLGAIGLPAPTGLAATVAGSLAAAGRVDWLVAGAVAVAASVLGDAMAYGIGRGVSEQFLARRGRWLGLSANRQAHARALFERWGALTVLVTRTLVSHLSSAVSLLAGLSHYRLAAFLAVALFGRMLWTTAYMGLGYGIGGNIEYATDFLKSFSLLLVSVSVLVGSLLVAAGRIRIAARGPASRGAD